MTAKELPLSGYAIEKVYTTDLELKHQAPDSGGRGWGFGFSWDWRKAKDRIEVALEVKIGPSVERAEALHARVVGQFRQTTDRPNVAIENFVQLQAVAILLPYVRQALSTLTLMSYHGVFHLPSINVAALMADYDKTKATGTIAVAAANKPSIGKASSGPKRRDLGSAKK